MFRFKSSLRFLLLNTKGINKNSTRSFGFRSKFFSSQPESSLENAGPLASRLKSRSVIRFRGPDTVKFLQGLLTNDLRRFGEDAVGERKNENPTSTIPTSNMPTASYPPVYSAMLTPQGRFLYDFFFYRRARSDQKLDGSGSGPGPGPGELELFADVDASVIDELLDTLKRYRLRSEVDIENVGEEYCCWQRYGGNLSDNSFSEEPEAASVGWGGNVDRSAISSAHGNSMGWQWYNDPRLHCLGFRGIFPSNTTPPLVEADKETVEENYLLWRLEKGVAEGSNEIPKGDAIPLEYNLAGLNAISFDKGCYIGQELVARTHHRGVIRKRLLPLKFVNETGKEMEQRVVPGSDVTNPGSGKKVGSVTTALGSRGLGLLRLDEAFKGSGSLTIQGSQDVKVEVIKPGWWPADWARDYQEETAVA
ncbi:hypothetical protein V2J09_007353 [Rumex salicifolius]